MVTRYIITIDNEQHEFVPYNSDTIEITFTPDDKAGVWQWIYNINEIEIGGQSNLSDYQWLYNKLTINKCRICYLTVYCDSKVYEFKFNYWKCEFNLDECIINIKPSYYLPNYDNFILQYDDDFDITANVTDKAIHAVWGTYNYPNAKKLSDILDYMCNSIGCSWTSRFLTDVIPPIPFPIGYLDAPFNNSDYSTINIYGNLHITNSSSRTDAIEMSLSQLLDALCNNHLNLRWRFIEDTNTLEIEHYKYFNNSLSYSNMPIIGIDATTINGGIYLDETNKYNIPDVKLYSDERWYMPIKQADAVQAGVQNGSISNFNWRFIYDCAIEPNTINKTNTYFETNVEASDRIPSSELLLVAVDIPNVGFISEFQQGPNHYIMNFPFVSTIIYKLWLWNRPFPLGHRFIGQAEFAMESTLKSLINEISIPICCADINPYELVKTGIGDGYIDTYIIDLTTGMVTFKLKYEDL